MTNLIEVITFHGELAFTRHFGKNNMANKLLTSSQNETPFHAKSTARLRWKHVRH